MLWLFDLIHNYATWQVKKKALFEIIDSCSKGKKFIAVGKYGTRWINRDKQGSITFSQSSLKNLWNTYSKTVFSTWKQNI